MLSNKLEAAFSKDLLLRDWLGTTLLVVTDCFCNTCELFHALSLIYKSLFWPTNFLTFDPSNSLSLLVGKEWVNDWVGAFLYLPARVKPAQQYLSPQFYCQWPRDGTWTLCLDSETSQQCQGSLSWASHLDTAAPKACPLSSGQHNSLVWALWTFPNYCYQDSGMFS